MTVYDMPCPQCGGKIVSTARMIDDTRAPTFCEAGHKFMRSEAYAKPRKVTMKIEAAARIKADLEEEYKDESSRLTEEKKDATPERKKDITRRQEQLKTYKEDHKPKTDDPSGMKSSK